MSDVFRRNLCNPRYNITSTSYINFLRPQSFWPILKTVGKKRKREFVEIRLSQRVDVIKNSSDLPPLAQQTKLTLTIYKGSNF